MLESLVEYLDETDSKVSISELRGIKVSLAHNRKYHSFSAGRETSDKVIRVEETELCSTHEEADTQIYLHATYVVTTSNDINIVSQNTDVVIIALKSHIPSNFILPYRK